MEMLNNSKTKISITLFLLVFSAGIIWALSVPGNTEAPDESSHLNMISFLSTEKRIPVFNHEEKIVQTVYDPKLPSGAYYSMAYNSPLSYLSFLPFYSQQVREDSKSSLFVLRLVSSFFLAIFGVFLFLGLDKISSQKKILAVPITLFIVLIPQVIFSAGYINIEPFALFLSALSFYLYLLFKEKQSLLRLIILGSSLGLLGLTKSNYLVFVAYLGILLLWDLINSKNRQKPIKNYLYLLLIFVVINSWWWIRNYQLYGDPLILGYIKSEIIDKAPAWLVTPRQLGYNPISLFRVSDFRQYTFYGFFANLGGANIYLPVIFYWLFYMFNIILIILSFIKKESRVYGSVFLLLTLSFLLYFANKNLDDFSPQGRHLFPLLIPLSVVLLFGLDYLQGKLKKIISVLLVTFTLISSLIGLLLTYTSYYVQTQKGVLATSFEGMITSLSWISKPETVESVFRKIELTRGQTFLFMLSIMIVFGSVTYLIFQFTIVSSRRRRGSSGSELYRFPPSRE